MRRFTVFVAMMVVFSTVVPFSAFAAPTQNYAQQEEPDDGDGLEHETNNTTKDVSDIIGIDLPPGKRMNFTIHDLNTKPEDDEPVIEFSSQSEGKTLQRIALEDVNLSQIRYMEIYRNGEPIKSLPLDPRPFYSIRDPSEESDRLLSTTTRELRYGNYSERDKFDDIYPRVFYFDDKLVMYFYNNESTSRYSLFKVNSVGEEKVCTGEKFTLNGTTYTDFNTSEWQNCDEFNVSVNSTLQTNLSLNGSNLSIYNSSLNVTYPNIGDISGVTQITFDATAKFYKTGSDGEYIIDERRLEDQRLLLPEIANVSDLNALNETFRVYQTEDGERVGLRRNGEYQVRADVYAFRPPDTNNVDVEINPGDPMIYKNSIRSDMSGAEFWELVEIENIRTQRTLVRNNFTYDPIDPFNRTINGFPESDNYNGSLDIPGVVNSTKPFSATGENVTNIAGESLTSNFSVRVLEADTTDTIGFEQRTFSAGETQNISFTLNDPSDPNSDSFDLDDGFYRVVLLEESQEQNASLRQVDSTVVYFTENGAFFPADESRYDESSTIDGDLDIPRSIKSNSSFISIARNLSSTYDVPDDGQDRSPLKELRITIENETVVRQYSNKSITLPIDPDETNTLYEDEVSVPPGEYTAVLTEKNASDPDDPYQLVDRVPVTVLNDTVTVGNQTFERSDELIGNVRGEGFTLSNTDWNATAEVRYEFKEDVSDSDTLNTDLTVALANDTDVYEIDTNSTSISYDGLFSNQQDINFTGIVDLSDGQYTVVLLEQDGGDASQQFVAEGNSVFVGPSADLNLDARYNQSTTIRGALDFQTLMKPGKTYPASFNVSTYNQNDPQTTDFRVSIENTSITYDYKNVTGLEVPVEPDFVRQNLSGPVNIDTGTYWATLKEKNASDGNDTYELVDRVAVRVSDADFQEPVILNFNQSTEFTGDIEGESFAEPGQPWNATAEVTYDFYDGKNPVVTDLTVGLANASGVYEIQTKTKGFSLDQTETVNFTGTVNLDDGRYQTVLLENDSNDPRKQVIARGNPVLVGQGDDFSFTTPTGLFNESGRLNGTVLSPSLVYKNESYEFRATIENTGTETYDLPLNIVLARGQDQDVFGETRLNIAPGETKNITVQANTGENASRDIRLDPGPVSIALLVDDPQQDLDRELITQKAGYLQGGNKPEIPSGRTIIGKTGYSSSDDVTGNLNLSDVVERFDPERYNYSVTNQRNSTYNYQFRVTFVATNGEEFNSTLNRRVLNSGETKIVQAGRSYPDNGIYTAVLLERNATDESDPWEGVTSKPVFVTNTTSVNELNRTDLSFDTRFVLKERVNVTGSPDTTTVRTIAVTVPGRPTEQGLSIVNERNVNADGSNVTFTSDLQGQYENGTSFSESFTQRVESNSTSVTNVDAEIVDVVATRPVTVINGTEYTTTVINNTTINPISEITVLNNTTLKKLTVDLPGNESYQWVTCDTSFARPGGEGEENYFYLNSDIRVGLQPNQMVISDYGDSPVTNTTYPYPSDPEGTNVSVENRTLKLFPDSVRVYGCAYVVSDGGGVRLPDLVGDGNFTRSLNTYYLNTETVVEPFGLVGEYLDPVENKTAVTGFQVLPTTGNATIEITEVSRAQSTQFGASVFDFRIKKDSGTMDLKVKELQPRREYTLYQNGRAIDTEVAGEEGQLTFGIGDNFNGEYKSYSVVVGERRSDLPGGDEGNIGSIIPSIQLTTPAIIFLSVLGILGLVAGFLYYRQRESKQEAQLEWYR